MRAERKGTIKVQESVPRRHHRHDYTQWELRLKWRNHPLSKTPEDIFNGEEDFGPTEEEPETDDIGTGAVIASIHVEEENDEEDNEVVVYAATMATSRSDKHENDERVTTSLMKSIKVDYEVRGSGIKPRPVSKTKEQLKANSTREGASNSKVRTNRPYNSNKQLINRQGLPALVKVNGIEAYTCWDSGSELNTISPDFTWATGIRPKPKENTLKIRLGTKGSRASTSYEATPMLDFGKTKLMHKLDESTSIGGIYSWEAPSATSMEWY